MMDDSDCVIPCPYNKSHILYKSRMQTHLKKCSYANAHPQLNVDPIKMKICCFNTNHHIPAAELEAHEASCPDSGTLVRFLYTSGQPSAVPYCPIELPPTDENWDDDADVSTYNPEEHALGGVILRAAQGLPRAERKMFRLNERERINRIRENEEFLEKEHKVAPKPQPVTVVEKHAFTEQALRHPKEGQLGMGRGRQLATNRPLARDDDFSVQGIGRAYTLKGMSAGLPDVPPMRPRGVNAPSTSGIVNAPSTSGIVNAPSTSGTLYAPSTSGTVYAPSTSATVSDDISRLSSASSDSDGFMEQRGRKNRKKAKGPGQLAASSNNPLTTPGSLSTFAFPGLPGKGRGRIRKN